MNQPRKRPIGILLLAIYFLIAAISIFFNFFNSSMLQARFLLLGTFFGILDILGDVVMLLLFVFLFYGFLRARRWAWYLFFVTIMYYLIGELIGLAIMVFLPERGNTMLTILFSQKLPIPYDVLVLMGFFVFVFHILLIALISWYVYQKRLYFRG